MTKYVLSYIPGNVGNAVKTQQIRSRHLSEKQVFAMVKEIIGMPRGQKLNQKTFEEHGGVHLMNTEGTVVFEVRKPDRDVKNFLVKHPPKKKFLAPPSQALRLAIAA